jgi:hypothetical protein
MSSYEPSRVLWSLADSGTGKTLSGAGSGNSGQINIIDLDNLLLTVVVMGTSTGTTPTLDVQIDVQDPQGNWINQVVKITQLTAGPGSATASCGLNINGSGSMVLPQVCRVSWTLGGTNPVFPQTFINLIGR